MKIQEGYSRLISVVCFLTIFLFSVANVQAQRIDSVRSFAHGHKMRNHDRIPNLTDDQKKKIEALKTPFAKEIMPLNNLLAEKRAHLKTLQTADKADLNSINSTIDEMAQLQSQIMKKNAAHTQAVRKLLTDDQRIAYDMKSGMHGRGFRAIKRRGPNHG